MLLHPNTEEEVYLADSGKPIPTVIIYNLNDQRNLHHIKSKYEVKQTKAKVVNVPSLGRNSTKKWPFVIMHQ